MNTGYHTPGRAWPRDRTREPFDPQRGSRRRLAAAGTIAAAGAPPAGDPVIELRGASRRPHVAATQAIHTRQRWTDAWTARPYLWATTTRWTCAPEMPAAALVWDYGYIARDRSAGDVVQKLNLDQHFVRITWTIQTHPDDPPAEWQWFGVVEATDDDQTGQFPARAGADPVATGQQAFACYGLERLLERHLILTGTVYDYPTRELVTVGRGLTFNADGRPNREQFPDDDTPVFTNHHDDAELWSVRQIVEHLLTYHTPANTAGDASPPFVLDDPRHVIPDQYHPTLATDGRATLDLLRQLLPRDSLYSFRFAVNDADQIALQPFTFAPETIALDVLPHPLPHNADRAALDFTADPTAQARTAAIRSAKADQTIVRGARRTATLTLHQSDATLNQFWTHDAENEYITPTLRDTDPDTTELEHYARLIAHARGRDELADVYELFGLTKNWHRKGGRGDGDAASLEPALPQENAAGEILDDPAPLHDLDARLARELPLLDNTDYAAEKIDSGTVDDSNSTGQHRQPFVAWQLPESDADDPRFVLAEMNAQAEHHDENREANHEWAGSYQAADGRHFRFVITGAPRHVIDQPLAGADPANARENLGANKWDDHMFATVTIEEDRYAEGRYPPDADLDAAAERITRDLLDAGDAYRCDYIVPQTVVDVDSEGRLARTFGGFVRDDRPALQALAKIAHQWRQADRRTLELSTELLTAELYPGRMLTTIGDVAHPSAHSETLETVVTEATIAAAIGSPESTEPPTLTIRTQSAELDVLRIAQAPR